MNELPDGQYDALIVDAEILDETTLKLEIVITRGDAKGEVIALRGPHLADDAMTLLGLPVTLRVVDGVPRIELDAS
jgi:hypothetical protein